jgi:pyruvate kinase
MISEKRTKIVCTLGPATETVEMIRALVDAGMNVARLNFSHGTYENHAMLIARVRQVEQETGRSIAIVQDLQGPKIRVGTLPTQGVELRKGETVVFDTACQTYEGGSIPVGYSALHTHVQIGERLLLDDGNIEVSITDIDGTRIHTTIVVGGTLLSHKGINIPDSHLALSAMTDKDREDVQFGVEHNVDFIALSFVTSAQDIDELRSCILAHEHKIGNTCDTPISIIAKIERASALEHIEEILASADGIMIARGDLGIETQASQVPLAQKRLIALARATAKPVIVATQMLDSMQHNPRPTRAEVSDVANAVIDHADAVMLSNESATGEYPLEAVTSMAETILVTEASVYDDIVPEGIGTVRQALKTMEGAQGVIGILLSDATSETVRHVSQERIELPLYAMSSDERLLRQLNLVWGVVPCHKRVGEADIAKLVRLHGLASGGTLLSVSPDGFALSLVTVQLSGL